MELIKNKEQEIPYKLDDHHRSEAISTSFRIVEALKDEGSGLDQRSKRCAASIYGQKILDLLPKEVDALSLFEWEDIRRESFDEVENPIVWDEYSVKCYIKELNKSDFIKFLEKKRK